MHRIALRHWFFFICLAIGSPVPWAASATAKSDGRCNIVLVLIDNCGKEWFGCYGSDEQATPNIDRLAAEGTLFDVCYTVPICGPSRAMLLTGRYPYRTGWTLHHDAALYSGGGLDPTREVTLARPLRQAGYTTAVVGKWQIDNLYDRPAVLDEHGFDRWCVWPGSIDRQNMTDADLAAFRNAIENRDGEQVLALNKGIESRYWNPVLNIDGTTSRHQDFFGPDLCQEYALNFIRENASQPFFLYYPMVLTHGISVKQPVVGLPPDREARGSESDAFREMVRYADKQVASLVTTLDELKIRSRTLVIVATDNGTEPHLSASFRGRSISGGLYTIHETGINVPLIFNLPGTVIGGLVGSMSDFTDLLPTLCDFAGASLPSGVPIDGKSHKAFLMGSPGAEAGREFAFTQYHTDRMARSGRYKLYSDQRFCRVDQDLSEVFIEPKAMTDSEKPIYRALADYLKTIPEDARLPFDRRSITAFQWGIK